MEKHYSDDDGESLVKPELLKSEPMKNNIQKLIKKLESRKVQAKNNI